MPDHILVYIFAFGCVALVIGCFIRCFNIPFDRRHIRDLRDIQAIQQREEEIDELGREREIREYFVRANLERLELASSLENYVRYIRSVVAEQERLEKIKEAEETIRENLKNENINVPQENNQQEMIVSPSDTNNKDEVENINITKDNNDNKKDFRFYPVFENLKNFQKSINEKKILKPNFFDAKKVHFLINQISSIG